MIRTTTMTMMAVGLFTLAGLSAMAATPVAHRHGKASVVAQADGATPSADAAKPQKKIAKKVKVTKSGKDKPATTDGTTAGTPAGTTAPEKMPDKK